MKKLLYTLLAALTIVGCTKDDVETYDLVTFTASDLTVDDPKTAWSGNELIAIIIEQDNEVYSSAYCYTMDSDGNMSAIDSSNKIYHDGNAFSYHAFYPYVGGYSIDDYLARASVYDAESEYMTSTATANLYTNFTFTHIYSVLNFGFICGTEYSTLPEFTAKLEFSDLDDIELDLTRNSDGSVTSETLYLMPRSSLDGVSVVMSLTDGSGKEYSTSLSSSAYPRWRAGTEYNYDNMYVGSMPVASYVTFARGESESDNIATTDGTGQIASLLSKFRRCLAVSDGNGNMTITYLDNNNTELFSDGSEATLDGTQGDVMVYFPEYWYKYEGQTNEFRYYISETAVDGYIHVPASLVGAYKSYVYRSVIYSRSDVVPTSYTTYEKFQEYISDRGTGYQMIDYNQHCTIALMLYARYEDRNVQSYLGVGGALYDDHQITGSTNEIGNADTENEGDDENNDYEYYVNGLGLEGVYGGLHEWVSGVEINGNVWTIENTDGSTRNVTSASTSGYITSMAIEQGEYFDMVPTATAVLVDNVYYNYTDYYGATSFNDMRLMRSGSSSGADCGVGYAYVNCSSTYSGEVVTTRLAFRGNITEVSADAFKALQ